MLRRNLYSSTRKPHLGPRVILFAVPLKLWLQNRTVAHSMGTQTKESEKHQEKMQKSMDGNTASAYVAYGIQDSAFIYPITPSSDMGEHVDSWASEGRKNCFGQSMQVTEMQSEAGAAGALHGALKGGAQATTFTASQGLLLMIPNMYKICGELLPCCMHVAARTVATHALSIFGDHSDVMACRETGWSMISSDSVQMVHDMALTNHLATLESRIPIIHFFDGFRTSHEANKIEVLSYDAMAKLLPHDLITAHRQRSLNPRAPHIQGAAQGPEVFFQAAESSNLFHAAVPEIWMKWAKKVAAVTGRSYSFFEYVGDPNATDVIILMGSGCETAELYVKANMEGRGIIKVRMYRPWFHEEFLRILPKTVQRISVLDRCKDASAQLEPLSMDVHTSLFRSGQSQVKVISGRYGISSKDFNPSHIYAVFKNMKSKNPKERFTVGIEDDVTHLSLPAETVPNALSLKTSQCLFFGLGSDGTVGANKLAVKLIAENTKLHSQAYFQYDAKKSGGITISHLRLGPDPIKAPYYVSEADYIGIHKFGHVHKYDMLKFLKPEGIVVLNASFKPEEAAKFLPAEFRRELSAKNAKLYIIDAAAIGDEVGLGKRINMVMQTVFFYLHSHVLEFEKAKQFLIEDLRIMYGKKGDKIVNMNVLAIERSARHLKEVPVPTEWKELKRTKLWEQKGERITPTPTRYPKATQDYIGKVLEPINRLEGDDLPVSAFVPGGSVPLGTSAFEKRGIALKIPNVDMDKCTQCNYCSMICPHAAIRPFLLTSGDEANAPESLKKQVRDAIGGGKLSNYKYTVQVSPYDCTGCMLCERICPSDAIKMDDFEDRVVIENSNWLYASELPTHGSKIDRASVKGSQFQRPLLEFSGACEGCGETPYVKLLTQLVGERAVIANATGCSSIWGAYAPSFPYATNDKGEGPAWANSLFEDNAEFGLGMRKAQVHRQDGLLLNVDDTLSDNSVSMSPKLRQYLMKFSKLRAEARFDNLLGRGQSMYKVLADEIIPILEEEKNAHPKLKGLYDERDCFMRFSQWIVGGDGWAYDIGFGGLDHVIASGEHVRILVLDTEVYSNTGGQSSKSTPMGATAKFAAMGKKLSKKELGLIAMNHRNVYVASICIHANLQQSLAALLEAESYQGPAIVLAYSPCIAHGYAMDQSIDHCKRAVETGYWPLYRFNPSIIETGGNPFTLDSKKVTEKIQTLIDKENRFTQQLRANPEQAKALHEELQKNVSERHRHLREMVASFDSRHGGLEDESATSKHHITILYGSETGNAMDQAKTLSQDLIARGKATTVSALDDFEYEKIQDLPFVVFVVSTCGLGEFPANCQKFWKWLSEGDHSLNMMNRVNFCVFGLGDSTYTAFCSSAKAIEQRMMELGGNKILPIGLGDDVEEDKYFTGWENWQPLLYKSQDLPILPKERVPPKSVYQIDVTPTTSAPMIADLDVIPAGGFSVKLSQNKLLSPEGYDRDLRHYIFDISDGCCSYSIGDSLAIYPRNDPKLVDAFCKMYGLNPRDELDLNYSVDARNKLPTQMNVSQLVSMHLDIFGKPNKKFYENMWLYATDDAERQKLEKLSTGADVELLAQITAQYATYFDVLKMFPSARPPLDQLLNILPTIRPRSYSIASSPLMYPNEIHLCVVAVDWEIPATKEVRKGLCTGYMMGQADNSTQVATIRKSAIILPEDLTRPVICAGMGTGLAPWRAVAEHRTAQRRNGQKVGPTTLFFGARYEKKEFMFRDEFLSYSKEGTLDLFTAFSRDQAHKIYVQHRIKEESKRVFDQLVKEGGSFYVCGTSRNVPVDIENAIKEVFMKEGNMSEDAARAEINTMKNQKRYVVEAWA